MPDIVFVTIVYFIIIAFWLLILYYALLFVAGSYFRLKEKNKIKGRDFDAKILEFYPSVSILIPAYNEGIVIADTLYYLSKLKYDGELEIILLDDSSKDNTNEIGKYYERMFENIKCIKVPDGLPKGKSRVLNYGASISDSKYLAVYDADNQPEPYALKLLVEKAELTENSCGAVGYVKTNNFYKNALTRMIALEFSIFQLVMQCGRWQLGKLGTYTGTNMIVNREIIKESGFWDVNAIAEDLELSVRLCSLGYICPVVPESRTWEQEPETFRVWFRQRSRWMLGNLYIIEKALKTPEWRKKRAFHFTAQMLSVFILFIALLILSHAMFVGGVIGLTNFNNIVIPSLYVWFLSWLFYVVFLIGSQFVDSSISLGNIVTALLMYLTYAQFWIVLAVKSLFLHFKTKISKKKTTPKWDKTNRF